MQCVVCGIYDLYCCLHALVYVCMVVGEASRYVPAVFQSQDNSDQFSSATSSVSLTYTVDFFPWIHCEKGNY